MNNGSESNATIGIEFLKRNDLHTNNDFKGTLLICGSSGWKWTMWKEICYALIILLVIFSWFIVWYTYFDVSVLFELFVFEKVGFLPIKWMV